MKILIADSGSTKTDWVLAEDGKLLRRIRTKGINPVFQAEEEMAREAEVVAQALEKALPETVCFYGAGCIPTHIDTVKHALMHALPGTDRIEVHTDMLGAARGLCGHHPGIACILGTGSNSCLYDGQQIVANVSPLGFILGDEGSGAVLGKLLVGSLLKNQMTPALKEAFLAETGLTPAEIIERVYRKPFPNRFLASLSPFIAQNLQEPCIRRLVLDSFRDFFRRNAMQYEDYNRYPIHCTGSIAFHYREVLEEAAAGLGLHLGTVVPSPLEGLIAYHHPQ